nr:polymorphic toxin type 46 domain-containing protein [Duganella violaceicalia]
MKLSDPNGDDEASKIASAREVAEQKKRFDELKKNIQRLEQLVAEQKLQARRAQPSKQANNKIAARKDGVFKATSIAPSFNLTPVGPSMVPLPYPTTADLSSSVNVASNVRFNGKQVYTLGSSQPSCKGDEQGSGGGVRSGTVNGEVKPVVASKSVRVEGKRVVRDGDACTMNGGNNPGIYVTVPPTSGASPNDALATSNPPVKLETEQEKSAFKQWLRRTEEQLRQAASHPAEAVKGAAKGVANIPSHICELLLKAAAEQRATELDQSAAMQAAFGRTEATKTLSDVAAETRRLGANIDVPKLKMENPAQEGGDVIATAVQLFAGGAGIVKSAAKRALTLGKTGEAARVAGASGEMGKGAVEASTVGGAEPTIAPAGQTGDGVRVAMGTAAQRRRHLNEKFGRTRNLDLDINIRGSQQTATNFFLSQGVPEEAIPSYMTGIDLTKPVEVQTLGSQKQLWQYQTSGAPQGNWYSLSPSVEPTELGISPLGFNRATQTVEPKILNLYKTTQPTTVLRSTSAEVEDFWSVKGQSYPTTGGARQLFSNKKSVFSPDSQ